MTNLEKNLQIKQSLAETKAKRKNQICKVFELKISKRKLSKLQKEILEMFFIEAKWIYNDVLRNDPFNYKYNEHKEIIKLDKNKNEIKQEIKYIPSLIHQSICESVKQNILTLSKMKEKGIKVGSLKFISECNSINLKQYKSTHKIIDHNKIHIMGIKKPLRIRGLKQIKESYDIANAKLICIGDDYYIKLTCYINKDEIELPKSRKFSVGLDFGIKTNITTSEGEKFNISIKESERIKKIQYKISKSKKGSNNRRKLILKLRRYYNEMANKKKDCGNKLIHYLENKYENIIIQDELIRKWHSSYFGKQVQNSCMGFIKQKLKMKDCIIIPTSFASTQICYKCGHRHKNIKLNDRIFVCPSCNLNEDRDIKSAKLIMYEGLIKLVGMECTDFKLEEPFKKEFLKYKTLKLKALNQEDTTSLV